MCITVRTKSFWSILNMLINLFNLFFYLFLAHILNIP